jgi:iron complex outermembrane receptor protein
MCQPLLCLLRERRSHTHAQSRDGDEIPIEVGLKDLGIAVAKACHQSMGGNAMTIRKGSTIRGLAQAQTLDAPISAQDAVAPSNSGASLEVVPGTVGGLVIRASAADGEQPGGTTPSTSGVETVVVSGEKRPENIQNVPASVQVITGTTLERANVRDFDDLVKVAPSLTISKTTQPGNNSINIRGIGTYAFSIATESSVAVVVDDVPQAFQATAFSALVDVQQVEVLRGPQSTLFGKSSSAGVILITTEAVSPQLSGRLEAMTTDDREHRVQGTISAPITSTLGFRLSANFSEYRGNIFNLATGQWLNGSQDTTLRGKLNWRPTSAWDITLSPFYTRTLASCCVGAVTFVPAGATTGRAPAGPIAQSVFLAGITPGPDNRRTRMDVDARGNAQDYGAGLKVTRAYDGFTLSSITSHDRYHLLDRQDTDSTAVDFGSFVAGDTPGGSANGGYFKIRSLTQEFRLTSPDNQPLTYVAGLYYSDTHSSRYFVRGSNTLDDYSASTPPGVFPPPSDPVGATPNSLPTTNSTTFSRYLAAADATNYAIFGQGSLALTRQFDLLAGLRVNREDIDYAFFDLDHGVTYGSPKCSHATPSGLTITTCDSDTSLTGRAGVRYKFTADIMGFATYSRGYKGKAFDLTSTLTTRTPAPAGSPHAGFPLGDTVAANQPVPEETVNDYEVGLKSVLFDDHLTLNVTGFYMDFAGFQAQTRDAALNQNLLNSIPQVTSKGVELELAARFGDITLSGAATYDRAVMDSFPQGTCFQGQTVAQGCVGNVQDLSGQSLPSAPAWSYSTNAQYDFPIAADVTLFVTGAYHWQSPVYFDIKHDPASFQDAYGVADFAVGIDWAAWRLTAFVNNAFDKRYALVSGREAQFNQPAGQFAANWKPARDFGRYFGVRASVKT